MEGKGKNFRAGDYIEARFRNDSSTQSSRESAVEHGDGGEERFSLVRAMANLKWIWLDFLNENLRGIQPLWPIVAFGYWSGG